MKYVLIGASNPHSIRIFREIKKNVPDIELVGFIDNDPLKIGSTFFDYPVIGGTNIVSSLDHDYKYVNLITRDCLTRFSTSREVYIQGGSFTNLIHPTVSVSMVSFGTGNYIQENVLIQAGVSIKNNSSIHMGALIGHETTIGSSVFIAHGVSVSGCVNIHDGVFIGAGAVICPRVVIGSFAIIGAGAVVRKNVKQGEVIVGNPAKVLKMQRITSDNADPFI
jgi:sugar O-acyltransferase (sialic acid O-acetyltransferase NeuD family)